MHFRSQSVSKQKETGSPPVDKHSNEKNEAHEGQCWDHDERDDPFHFTGSRSRGHAGAVLVGCVLNT